MTGTEQARGPRRAAAPGRSASRGDARRPAATPSTAEPGVRVRTVPGADRGGRAAVELAVMWSGRVPRDLASTELAELVGVGSAFDGAEWHFYPVNAEPSADLEGRAAPSGEGSDAARDRASLGVR